MDRRDFLRTGSVSVLTFSGCSQVLENESKTPADIDRDVERSGFGADPDNGVSRSDLTETEAYKRSEDLVDDIQRLEGMMDRGEETRYKTQIYLGGINQHGNIPSLDFTIEDDEVIERFRDVEEAQIIQDLRSEKVLQLSNLDGPEIPLLLDNQVNIDVVYLQDRTELQEVVKDSTDYLHNHLRGFLEENYSLNVSKNIVPTTTDTSTNLEQKADRLSSEMEDYSLKIFLTERDLEVDGFTDHETGKAFVKIEQIDAVDKEDFLETFVHETYHNLFDLPHTAYEDYLLSLEGESMSVSSRNVHLARRYLSSVPKISTSIYDNRGEQSMNIELSFNPEYQVSPERNRQDIFRHFESYIREQENFPIDDWQRAGYNPERLEINYSRNLKEGQLNLSFSIDDERYFRTAELTTT